MTNSPNGQQNTLGMKENMNFFSKSSKTKDQDMEWLQKWLKCAIQKEALIWLPSWILTLKVESFDSQGISNI